MQHNQASIRGGSKKVVVGACVAAGFGVRAGGRARPCVGLHGERAGVLVVWRRFVNGGTGTKRPLQSRCLGGRKVGLGLRSFLLGVARMPDPESQAWACMPGCEAAKVGAAVKAFVSRP